MVQYLLDIPFLGSVGLAIGSGGRNLLCKHRRPEFGSEKSCLKYQYNGMPVTLALGSGEERVIVGEVGKKDR